MKLSENDELGLQSVPVRTPDMTRERTKTRGICFLFNAKLQGFYGNYLLVKSITFDHI